MLGMLGDVGGNAQLSSNEGRGQLARSSSMAYSTEPNSLSISRFKLMGCPVQLLSSWRPVGAHSGAPEKALFGGNWMWSVTGESSKRLDCRKDFHMQFDRVAIGAGRVLDLFDPKNGS